MSFSFSNEVINFLQKNLNNLFTAREIAIYIAKTFPKDCETKIKTSKNGYLKTKEDCIQQWVAEIGASRSQLAKKGVSITAGRPRKYYIPYEETKVEQKTSAKRKNNQPEKELYPILAKFCNSRNIKTLRIDEKESKKDKGKNYNKWLHADVVGFQDLINNFNKQAKECLIKYSR